jgi:hypothetical protein
LRQYPINLIQFFRLAENRLTFLNIDFNMRLLVKTKEVLLKMEMKIEIPQDIMVDKKRLRSVQRGILKAISKGPYEEGLAFNIVKATFVDLYSSYNLPGTI